MASVTTPRDGTAAQRLEFWQEVVSQSLVPLEARPHEDADFYGALRAAYVGAVQVSVVATGPHSALRTRRLIGSDAPDFVKVSLQLEGRCMLSQGDRQAELRPGDLAVYVTRRPYTLDLDLANRSLVLMFPRAMLGLPERDLARATAIAISCQDGLGAVVRPFLYGLARQVGELESVGTPRLGVNVVGLLDTLLAERAGVDRPPQEDGRELLTRRILAYMDQRLADLELGPDQIAAAHRISRRYLYNLLAEHGYTVSGWIRERRLARCLRDLTDPALYHLPVGVIVGRWGFPDPAHFSHAFKAAYDISPREARGARSAV